MGMRSRESISPEGTTETDNIPARLNRPGMTYGTRSRRYAQGRLGSLPRLLEVSVQHRHNIPHLLRRALTSQNRVRKPHLRRYVTRMHRLNGPLELCPNRCLRPPANAQIPLEPANKSDACIAVEKDAKVEESSNRPALQQPQTIHQNNSFES